MRRKLRATRRALSPGLRKRAAKRICTTTLTTLRLRGARRVALYLAADGEVPTRSLLFQLHKDGIAIYLPVLRDSGRALQFRRYTPEGPLQRNRYHLLEPATTPLCPPPALDVVLLPLVGFDRHGTRLGMGGGYYDTTFAFLKRHPWRHPRLIGLAFECQRLSRIPCQPWDLALDEIITERGRYRAHRSVKVD
ncbi:5-formyltetrahydrofolate cyclo-ligase [Halorhodospira abdelmalekii]|nr:5-formyltetrahydrofolate cyclo-ligase [Halorhodospira abdelmalekii]